MVDNLKQDFASREAALVEAAAEFDKRVMKQEATSERLVVAETKRADAAEREAEDGRRQVKEERGVNGELKKRIEVMEAARKQIEEEARTRVLDVEAVKHEELIVLKEMVAELERMNDVLVEKAKALRKRYETNDLVGSSCWLCDGVLIHGRRTKKKISLRGYSSFLSRFMNRRMSRRRTNFAGFLVPYHSDSCAKMLMR
jgi:hypothetical protein